jgi:hypothetical protein
MIKPNSSAKAQKQSVIRKGIIAFIFMEETPYTGVWGRG